MSDRGLTAGVIAETESSEIRNEVIFVELLTTVPVYAWSGMGSLIAAMPGESSHTWLGIGNVAAIEAVVESSDRRRNGLNMSLSGIDSDILASALTEEYQGKSAKVWEAYLDDDFAIIPDPTLLFAGFMDTMTVADGASTGTISLTTESREQHLERSSRSLLTDQEQQRLFPGDLGLQFVTPMQSKQILWGSTAQGDSGGGIADSGGRGRTGRRAQCLSIDMPIKLHNGESRVAGEIIVGDVLLSMNADVTAHSSATVTLADRVTSPNYYLINEQLKVTGEHPFWVHRNGEWHWINARDLVPYDSLLTDKSSIVNITSVRHVNSPIDVMHISVTGTHTYFGGIIDNKPVLGHNK